MSSFVVTKRPIVAFPISALVYDDEGKPQKIEFVAQYKRLPFSELKPLQDALNNIMRKAQGLEPVPDEKGEFPEWKYKTDSEFLLERMSGWLGVDDESGNELKFTKANLEKVMDAYPSLMQPLFHGFFNAHAGAKEKNS